MESGRPQQHRIEPSRRFDLHVFAPDGRLVGQYTLDSKSYNVASLTAAAALARNALRLAGKHILIVSDPNQRVLHQLHFEIEVAA